jgi:hypothetical protein
MDLSEKECNYNLKWGGGGDGGRGEERGLKRIGMYKKELKWEMEWERWVTGIK